MKEQAKKKHIGSNILDHIEQLRNDDEEFRYYFDRERALESLLLGSPKSCFKVSQEDQEWLDDDQL